MPEKFDVIVIGAGHAGIEAAFACARLGKQVLVLTMSLEGIGRMSCNPAIGGLAKGHLVREIDALGGQMGIAADACGIQFRRLNMKKGPAVRARRAQADREDYRHYIRRVLEAEPGINVLEGMAVDILVDQGLGEVRGIRDDQGRIFEATRVIITTGTFLNGLMHVGMNSEPGGRRGEGAAKGLSESLIKLGLRLGRLKTGTCPRIFTNSVDFSSLEAQNGDEPPVPFSFMTDSLELEQVPCHITYTNGRTHDIIRGSLDRSPLYGGVIKGVGPRYCPSIEDKIVRFPDKTRHQIFIEPDGRTADVVYPNGISTSLPLDVQEAFVQTIPGLEKAEIAQPGYAIEYDFVPPTQLDPSLETKKIAGLYMAGQINGTSGYEEAAAQGLMAGINAALSLDGRDPVVLDRSEAYIGVLIDDLVTKGTEEPYRMFTSRAEYRLALREDNADLRLTEKGYDTGLVAKERYERMRARWDAIHKEVKRLKETRIKPTDHVNGVFREHGLEPIREAFLLADILKRPEATIQFVHKLENLCQPAGEVQAIPYSDSIAREVEVEIKYEGYLKRQDESVLRFRAAEKKKIPANLEYSEVHGLTTEACEKLSEVRPISLGQASRISGITPAAITAIEIHLKRQVADF